MKNLSSKLLLCFLFFSLLSCKSIGKDTVDAAMEQLDKSLDKALGAIDNAIIDVTDATSGVGNNVGAAASNIQSILDEMDDKIIGEAREMIDTDIAELAQNTIAATGIEFRCNADFLGNRVKRKLQQLKQKLLGGDPIPIEPVLCQVVPPIIDMTVSVNERNKIIFSGYDLKKSSTLKVYLISTNGNRREVSNKYSASTLYQGVLNLGSNGVNIASNTQSIELSYAGNMISEIPIIHSHANKCQKKTVSKAINPFSCRPKSYTLTGKNKELMEEFDYKLSNICKEQWRGNPKISTEVRLIVKKNHIDAETTMEIKGEKLAKVNISVATIPLTISAVASKTVRTRIYTAPSGFSIKRVLGPTEEKLEYEDSNTINDQFNGTAGLVQSFIIKGRQKPGDCDVNGKTEVSVRLNNLNIELIETGNCVDETLLLKYIQIYPQFLQDSKILKDPIIAIPPSTLGAGSIRPER